MLRKLKASKNVLCWKCQKETNEDDWLCDWIGCLNSVCRGCHLVRSRTAWCPGHRPVRVVPVLGWKIAPSLLHPGRAADPGSHESVGRLSGAMLSELSVDQVAARSILEPSRRKVVAMVSKFADWVLLHRLQARRAGGDKQKERRLVMQFLLDNGRAVASGRRKKNMLQNINQNIISAVRKRVCAKDTTRVISAGGRAARAEEPGVRPTTMTTWARLLASAFPEKLGRWLEGFMKGLSALAPASPPVERGNDLPWAKVQETARMDFKKNPSRVSAAVWLAIALQRVGLRPKAALRAAMISGSRSWSHLGGAQGLRVAVLLDKDNPVGLSPAPRVRFLPVSEHPHLPQLLRHLPLRDKEYKSAFDKRKELLAEQGVSYVISARRNAGEKADQMAVDPGQVLNHRPGSRSTVRYVGSATPAATVRALAGWGGSSS